MALEIHHFVSIVESCMGTPHSSIQKCVKSMCPHLMTWLWLSFFSLPTPNYDFKICYFLPVKCGSSWREQPQGDKVWDAGTASELIVPSERAGGDLVLIGRWFKLIRSSNWQQSQQLLIIWIHLRSEVLSFRVTWGLVKLPGPTPQSDSVVLGQGTGGVLLLLFYCCCLKLHGWVCHEVRVENHCPVVKFLPTSLSHPVTLSQRKDTFRSFLLCVLLSSSFSQT